VCCFFFLANNHNYGKNSYWTNHKLHEFHFNLKIVKKIIGYTLVFIIDQCLKQKINTIIEHVKYYVHKYELIYASGTRSVKNQ